MPGRAYCICLISTWVIRVWRETDEESNEQICIWVKLGPLYAFPDVTHAFIPTLLVYATEKDLRRPLFSHTIYRRPQRQFIAETVLLCSRADPSFTVRSGTQYVGHQTVRSIRRVASRSNQHAGTIEAHSEKIFAYCDAFIDATRSPQYLQYHAALSPLCIPSQSI